jgi:formate hydrogenlyase subunit 3/multisubunit Na+/H+ antiporter MnhD subunit
MSNAGTPNWLSRLFQGILGVLGIYAAIRFLPRVLKSMTRRFLFGLIGEILLVAVGLFLTRRATQRPSRTDTSPPPTSDSR